MAVARIGVLVLLVCFNAWAETALVMAPVVVTGVSLLDVFFPLTLASQTHINSQEIQDKQNSQLLDILRDIPGVTLSQSGGKGNVSSLFIRGSNANHVQVRMDGMEINNPALPDGRYAGEYFTIDGLEDIEIIRGPLSSLYGSGATGGSIILNTHQGEGSSTLKGTLEGGSFNTCRIAASAQGSTDIVDYALAGSELHSGGIVVTPRNLQRNPLITHKPDPYANRNLSARLGARLAPHFHISLFNRLVNAQNNYRVTEYPGESKNQQNLHRIQADLSTADERWQHRLGVGVVNLRAWDKTLFPGYAPTFNYGKRLQSDWHQSFHITNAYTVLGFLEYQKESFCHLTNQTATYGHNHNASMALHQRWQLLSNLTIEAGGRYEKHSRYKVPLTYRAALGYTLPRHIQVRVSWGTAFKIPSLFQRMVNGAGFKANPYLTPEKNRSWEMGVDIPLPFMTGKVGTTYYRNHFVDLIEYSHLFKQSINVGKALMWGIESYFERLIHMKWQIKISHTYSKAQNRILNQPLVRRPNQHFKGTVIWEMQEGGKVIVETLFKGNGWDIDPSTYERRKVSHNITFNVKACQQLTKQWQVFGRIENVLNYRYQDPLGYRQAGLGVFAGLRVCLP